MEICDKCSRVIGSEWTKISLESEVEILSVAVFAIAACTSLLRPSKSPQNQP